MAQRATPSDDSAADSAVPRRRSRPATSARRDDVLRLAAELFADKGFRATTVRDIAEAAGMLSGSLYHHFDSKESIVDELLSEFQNDLLARYQKAADADEPPRATFERLVEISFEAITRHRAAIVVYQQDGEYLAQFPRFAYLATTGEEIERIWVETLERGSAAGDLHTDQPKLTYQFIRDAIWVSVRWFRPDGSWTADDLSRHFLAIVVDGLARREDTA